MNQTAVTVALAAAMLSLTGGALVALREVERRDRRAARLALARGLAAPRPRQQGRSPLQLIADIGTAVAESGFLSPKALAELEQTLARAGFRSRQGLNLFVGGKLVGLVALPLLACLFLPEHRLGPLLHHVLVAAAGIGGLFVPDQVVKRLRARYVAGVERGLPDALDMLVICAEAGLSLVPAITRVGVEIRAAHPKVADELILTADELHVVSDTRLALTNMGTRTGLASLRRLATTLIQSQHYGTPLSHALRTLAAEMRGEMLIRFEERAARLPTLLTIPMILFILPSMFFVVGGPAMIHVIRLMHH